MQFALTTSPCNWYLEMNYIVGLNSMFHKNKKSISFLFLSVRSYVAQISYAYVGAWTNTTSGYDFTMLGTDTTSWIIGFQVMGWENLEKDTLLQQMEITA